MVIITTPAGTPHSSKTHRELSLNVPLNRLEDRLSELPRDRAIVVHCAPGYRSSIAASLLQRNGFPELAELTGGITAWEAAGFSVPTQRH